MKTVMIAFAVFTLCGGFVTEYAQGQTYHAPQGYRTPEPGSETFWSDMHDKQMYELDQQAREQNQQILRRGEMEIMRMEQDDRIRDLQRQIDRLKD